MGGLIAGHGNILTGKTYILLEFSVKPTEWSPFTYISICPSHLRVYKVAQFMVSPKENCSMF